MCLLLLCFRIKKRITPVRDGNVVFVIVYDELDFFTIKKRITPVRDGNETSLAVTTASITIKK